LIRWYWARSIAGERLGGGEIWVLVLDWGGGGYIHS